MWILTACSVHALQYSMSIPSLQYSISEIPSSTLLQTINGKEFITNTPESEGFEGEFDCSQAI